MSQFQKKKPRWTVPLDRGKAKFFKFWRKSAKLPYHINISRFSSVVLESWGNPSLAFCCQSNKNRSINLWHSRQRQTLLPAKISSNKMTRRSQAAGLERYSGSTYKRAECCQWQQGVETGNRSVTPTDVRFWDEGVFCCLISNQHWVVPSRDINQGMRWYLIADQSRGQLVTCPGSRPWVFQWT